MNFINFNGEIIPDSAVLTTKNRAFRYGDGLFESMRTFHHHIPFLSQHLIRLSRGMKLLGYKACSCINEENLKSMIIELCKKNDIEESARIRLSIFRKDGGLYAPIKDEFDFIIETSPMPAAEYQLNSKGLIIGIAKSVTKSVGPFSNIKTSNALNLVLAAREAKMHSWDDALILNDRGYIAEATSSNIFIVKNKSIFTPPIEDGAMDGIMRQQIALLVKNTDYKLRIKSLLPKDFETANEIFLTNAVRGIIRVVGFYNKRFYNETAKFLNPQLNNLILEKMDETLNN